MITTLSVTATPGKGYTFSTPAGTEATTALSVMATPGGLRTFAPKVPPVVPTGQITDLSVWATPGGLRTFTPKIPPIVPTGQITELTVWAIPGKRRYFIAKTPATPIPDPIDPPRGGSSTHSRIIREDEEILAVIMAAYHVLH